jgi:hypothetical protein
MRTIKTYFKGAPFYNAFTRLYPVWIRNNFRFVRDTGVGPYFVTFGSLSRLFDGYSRLGSDGYFWNILLADSPSNLGLYHFALLLRKT